MARVELREILTEGDRRAVLGLRRGPGQDAYLDSMEEIFLQAELEARAMPRQWAVHAGDGGRLVGFTMISDGIPEPIDAVVAYLRTRPGADTLFTSCADGPGSPRLGEERRRARVEDRHLALGPAPSPIGQSPWPKVPGAGVEPQRHRTADLVRARNAVYGAGRSFGWEPENRLRRPGQRNASTSPPGCRR
jgi:hypothetical protein